jgi:hypothetical protein
MDQPVGTVIRVDESRTQISRALNGRQYLKHTAIGTDPGTPDAAPGWAFAWLAPSQPTGPVTFYAAGVAANGNGFNTGDLVYDARLTVPEGPTNVAPTTWSAVRSLYRR